MIVRPDSLHPAYFETRFRVDYSMPEWPQEFVVVSAYATTGEQWTEEENERAAEELGATILERLDVWTEPVTGFSRETGHAEPSWAVELSLDDACDLGLRFRQDAIFHVRGDLLSVTHCDDRRALIPVGGFRERVDVDVDSSLARDEDTPWRHIQVEDFQRELDRRLLSHLATATTPGRVFVPEVPVSSGQALLDALPTDELRDDASEQLESDSIFVDDLAALFPDLGGVKSVIHCEVTDSMVGSVWGVGQFTLGGRGYLYYVTDYEGEDQRTPDILGAWEPVNDASARQACILSCYTRFWDTVGLPPLLGQWVEGDARVLHAGMLAALSTPNGGQYWSDVLERIRGEEEVDLQATGVISHVAEAFGLPSATIARALEELRDPTSDWAEGIANVDVLEPDRSALAGLFLACIMRQLPFRS